jgi:hypothetical protein
MMLLKIALDFAKHLESKDLANINALLDPDCLWILNGYIDKLEGANESVDYLKKIFKSHPNKVLSLTNPVQNSEKEISLDYHFLARKHGQKNTKIGTLKLAIENNLIKKITTYSKARPTNQDKPKKISAPKTSRKPLLNANPKSKLTYDPITGLPL